MNLLARSSIGRALSWICGVPLGLLLLFAGAPHMLVPVFRKLWPLILFLAIGVLSGRLLLRHAGKK